MSIIDPEQKEHFQQAIARARQDLAEIPEPGRISFALGSVEDAGGLFSAREKFGLTYGRTGTPENAALERLLATLEGGTASVTLASGQAANFLSVYALLPKPGDEIVASSRVFGGTAGLLKNFLNATGRSARFADPLKPESFRDQITPNTRAILVESVSNPDASVADIEALSDIARRYRIPLVVDNTLSPLLSRPISWGADLVTISLTKFFNGKGDLLGGAVIEAGSFPWAEDPRWWPAISGERAQGLPSLAATFNGTAFSALTRQNLTQIGPALNPRDAAQIIKNAADLDRRIEKQSESTRVIADFLRAHPQVEWVHYLGHEDHPSHKLAGKYLKAPPAILLFQPRGGYETTVKLTPAFTTIGHEANIGCERTVAIHSFDTTHRAFSPEQKAASRIERGAIRLSVGTEDVGALIEDLDRALGLAAPKASPTVYGL